MKSNAPAAVFLATVVCVSCAAVSAESEGMHFVTPTEGMTVRPGETIPIKVAIDSEISYEVVVVATKLQSVELQPPAYEGTLTIPETMSGAMQLGAFAFGQNDAGAIAEITLSVVPDEPPVELRVPRGIGVKLSDSEPTQLRVSGYYGNDIRRSLNFAGSGVAYSSSDPAVVTVDAAGAVTGVTPGYAYITVQLGSLQSYVRVDVEAESPRIIPAIDQTANVSISRSEFRVDPETGAVLQTLSIRNISGEPLFTPLVVVITELASGVVVMDEGSVTRQISPLGTPYELVRNGGAEFLLPNEVAEADLTFLNPDGVAINYIPRVYTAVIP